MKPNDTPEPNLMRALGSLLPKDMTPQLPPVLPGFSERIQGPLEHPMEPVNNTDVALLDGNKEWQLGWFDGDGHNFYSLRLGSPIALANGIGVVPEGKYVCERCGERTDSTRCLVITCNGRTHLPAAPVGEPTSDPCESEAKPEAAEYHGGFMSPERAQKMQDELAAANSELERNKRTISGMNEKYGELVEELTQANAAVGSLRDALEAANQALDMTSFSDGAVHKLVREALAGTPPAPDGWRSKLREESNHFRQTASEINRRAKACYLKGVADGIDYAIGDAPKPPTGNGGGDV